jgi:hypothetical protein
MVIQNHQKPQEVLGERAGIRTLDLLIKSQLLYRLSYALLNEAEVSDRLPSGQDLKSSYA